MQISKEVIEGLYKTQLLQTEDILSFIGTEIIDDYFMLVWSTDADRRRDCKTFAFDDAWRKAAVVDAGNDSLKHGQALRRREVGIHKVRDFRHATGFHKVVKSFYSEESVHVFILHTDFGKIIYNNIFHFR